MMNQTLTARPGGNLAESTRCKGALFVLVGPSAVGKNTIMTRVMSQRPQLRQFPTMTTREKRSNEEQGREHFFVTLDEFRKLLADNALIEHQEVYPGKFYGTPRQQMQTLLDAGRTMIADIDVLGASKLKEAFPDRVILIFIEPPTPDDLEKRLRERGNMSEEEIAKRLERAAFELKFAEKCEYRVVNDTLEHSVEKVIEIVDAELVKRDCVQAED
jgi:guanylate kinase